jgi:hypothetical protein
MNQAVLAVLSAVLLLCIGLALAYAGGRRAAAKVLAEAQALALNRIAELERLTSLMEISAVPVSLAMMALDIKRLTHFHTPEMDALLVKLGPPYTLDDEEADRLEVMLRERAQDRSDPLIDEEEREAAMRLPWVIKSVRRDRLRSGLDAEPLIRLLVVSDNSTPAG